MYRWYVLSLKGCYSYTKCVSVIGKTLVQPVFFDDINRKEYKD